MDIDRDELAKGIPLLIIVMFGLALAISVFL
jgi:hypothetical protein